MNRRERRLAEKQERKRRKQSRRSIEVRNDVPISLLADREVRSAVRETCQELRQLLGPSCQFIAEQVVEPEDEFAEPRLFLLAAMCTRESTMSVEVRVVEVEVRVVERVELPYENVLVAHVKLVKYKYEYEYELVVDDDGEDSHWFLATGVSDEVEVILRRAMDTFLKLRGFETMEDMAYHMWSESLLFIDRDGTTGVVS